MIKPTMLGWFIIAVGIFNWYVQPKQAVMVWNGHCVTGVEQTDATTLEAPMIDGKPDMSKAKLFGVRATYKPECGQIQMREAK